MSVAPGASTATITGVVGPGKTLTTQVFNNVVSVKLDCQKKVLRVEFAANGLTTVDIDVSGATTYTLTYSAPSYTLTVS